MIQKNYFYYDLHCHTRASIDSPTKIKDIVKIAKKRGLDGVAITDHNKTYQGPESIDGIDIIPGNEITLKDGGHLLAYFIEKDFSLNLSLKEVTLEIKKQNGYAVLAHPMRIEHGRLKNSSREKIKEDLAFLDGIESGNSSDSDKARKATLKLKEEHSEIPLFSTAGSDAHMAGQIGFGVVKTKEKLNRNNFFRVLLEAEIIIEPKSEKFRKEALFLKKVFYKTVKIFRLHKLQRLKSLFHAFVLRNYFRIKNRKFSRIRFNFKSNKD